MPLIRSLRWLPPVLAALACAMLLFPASATAAPAPEGPGYGGGADKLTVKRDAKDAKDSKNAKDGKDAKAQGALYIFGVGFRGESSVVVRIGSGAEQTVVADASGALRFIADVAAQGGGTPSGRSVLAVGRTPSGSALTLVGNVPPESTGAGAQDFVIWLILLLGLFSAGGGFAFRRRRVASPVSERHRGRPAQPAPGLPLDTAKLRRSRTSARESISNRVPKSKTDVK